ncbi:MAG TPA: RNA 2',3'-cyclic phosphodiesterase [Candidatus Acidoferrales bacterium]|nr:RNA 2',3'-cyclic phosphodiesterase [Candidatus Acidoferrales bacterium]
MRLFVALDFPDSIRDAIRDLIAKLKPLCKDARWVRPEGMHVTLKFIGHVDTEKLDPIITALAGVHSSAPVDMRFRGVGFFPTERRPRVFWCGIEASPNLGELAAGIEHALVPLGIEAEKREFRPHLTFARFESPKGTARLLEAAKEFQSLDLGTTRETEFHLYESVLHRSGAEYTKRKSFTFVKGAT